MVWVTMSERELNRIEILSQVLEDRLSVGAAASVLDLSKRQVYRLLQRFQIEGAAALQHRSRGKKPNNQIRTGVRDLALSLIRERYADFGPTLAAEMLLGYYGFSVSKGHNPPQAP